MFSSCRLFFFLAELRTERNSIRCVRVSCVLLCLVCELRTLHTSSAEWRSKSALYTNRVLSREKTFYGKHIGDVYKMRALCMHCCRAWLWPYSVGCAYYFYCCFQVVFFLVLLCMAAVVYLQLAFLWNEHESSARCTPRKILWCNMVCCATSDGKCRYFLVLFSKNLYSKAITWKVNENHLKKTWKIIYYQTDFGTNAGTQTQAEMHIRSL